MSSKHVILIMSPNGWRVAIPHPGQGIRWLEVSSAPGNESNSAEIAEHVAAALDAANATAGEALLALPASLCLAATIEDPQGAHRFASRQEELLYALEEELPLDAEEAVADFVSHDGAVWAVAAERPMLTSLLTALAERHIIVRSISPFALLALSAMVADGPAVDAILLPEDDGMSLVLIREGRPAGWRRISDGGGDSSMWLVGVVRLLVPAGLDCTFQTPPEIEVIACGDDAASLNIAVAEEGLRILSGRSQPWIEMCRDGLRPTDAVDRLRRPLLSLFASACLCLLVLNAVLFWSARQARKQISDADKVQAQMYREVHPEASRTPRGVSRQLAAELRAMRSGASTVEAPNLDTLRQSSAIHQLVILLSHWPRQLEVQLVSLRITDDLRFEIHGVTESFASPGRLADALRTFDGMAIDPPTTRRDSRGVRFTLAGRFPPLAQQKSGDSAPSPSPQILLHSVQESTP